MGFWTDLFNRGADAIDDAARTELQDALNRGDRESAHIAAQNQAVVDFEQDALAPRRANRISSAQATTIIQQIDQTFSAFCRSLGYPRATAGANDIHTLALQLIRDLPPDGTIPAPGGGGSGGGFPIPGLPPQIAGIDTMLLIVAAGFYFLMKRR